MSKNVFLTGGTGFLGSHIAVELLKGGNHVIFLARSKDGKAFERIEKVLRWHNYDFNESQLTVFSGDISQANFGLSENDYLNLPKNIDEIWHCASDTSFEEIHRESIERTNIDGTKNVLKYTLDVNCKRFNYISTAYVFGKRKGVCDEIFLDQTEFHNPYEETKYITEHLLDNECKNNNILLNIFRPSIIIGDSSNGRTLLFNAFYYPLRVLNYLKNMCLRDFEVNNGRNNMDLQVVIDTNGHCHFPLRINTGVSLYSSVNLVTIEFVVQSCVTINENMTEGGIYNLTNNKPFTLIEYAQAMSDFMDVHGVTTATDSDFIIKPENSLESMFNSRIESYLPYMKDERIFRNGKTTEFLNKYGITCSPINSDVLKKCIDYAQQCNWNDPLRQVAKKKAVAC